MPAKDANQKPTASQASEACWECLRRELDCDGGKPVCNRCRDVGLVCPGFGSKKPLTWVTPGKVTHRAPQRPSRRKGVAAKKTSNDEASGAKASVPKALTNPVFQTATVPVIRSRAMETIAHPANLSSGDASFVSGPQSGDHRTGNCELSNNSQSSGVFEDGLSLGRWNIPSSTSSWGQPSALGLFQQEANAIPASLWVEDYDFLKAVDYYMYRVYLPAARRQVIPSTYFTEPTDAVEKISLSLLSPCRRHSLMAMVTAHYICSLSKAQGLSMEYTKTGSTAHMWTIFYRHMGRAIRGLIEELSSNLMLSTQMFGTIMYLLVVEASFSISRRTLAHIHGFLALIDLQGGLRNLVIAEKIDPAILQVFITSCAITNTTSPSNDQIARVSQMDTDDLYKLCTLGVMPDMMCPPRLFLAITRINRLRLEAANDSSIMKAGNPGRDTARDILHEVREFSAIRWAQSCGLPHTDKCLLIARTFQCSVALYAIVSLRYDTTGASDTSSSDVVDELPARQRYRTLIFELIELAMDSLCTETMSWPLLVAGAVAESKSERAAVEANIDKVCEWLNFITPLQNAKPVLRRFWASGKTEWDDCFDRPYVFT